MKRTMTWIAAALLVMPAMLLTSTNSSALSTKATYTLTVLSPQGSVKKGRDLAPRLDTLKGKKIAMWLSATPDQLYAGKGAELYFLLEEMLKEKYADIQIVTFADLPMKFMPENEVVEAIVATQPDAVVAGFGG
jgi:ABC-type nitrate/sulfonate/bicarbonate transport system substrate-binding protein